MGKRNIHLATVLVGLGLALLTGCASTPPPAEPGPAGQKDASELTAWERETRSRAHYDLGVDQLAKGSNALALREFLAAHDYNPDDAWIHLGLGECYRRTGRFEKSEEHLLRATELKPYFQTAMLNLSALYVHLQRWDDAAHWAERLLDDPTYPAPWRALNNLGWAHLRAGRSDDARQALNNALEYDAGFWPAHLNLGILEAEGGKKLDAIRHFEQALEAQPGPFAEAELRYRMGEVFVSLGNRDRALEEFSVASSLKPGGPWVKKSQEYLELLQ